MKSTLFATTTMVDMDIYDGGCDNIVVRIISNLFMATTMADMDIMMDAKTS